MKWKRFTVLIGITPFFNPKVLVSVNEKKSYSLGCSSVNAQNDSGSLEEDAPVQGCSLAATVSVSEIKIQSAKAELLYLKRIVGAPGQLGYEKTEGPQKLAAHSWGAGTDFIRE